MHKSTDRILTTHAGSIPRGEPLGQMLIDEEAGKSIDKRALQSNIRLRVSHVLDKQAEAGIDIVNDGEQGRVGFQTYVTQRMSGFGGVSKRPYGKEFIEYPQFTKRMMVCFGHRRGTPPRACIKGLISLCEFRFRGGPIGADGDPAMMLIFVDLSEC